MSFLNLEGKTFLVFGVANKKSVAYHIGKDLESQGAQVIHVVRSHERREKVKRLLERSAGLYVCDVEYEDQINDLKTLIADKHPKIDGLIHSIAFANFEDGARPFHETQKKHFLQTIDISCYSLLALANAFKDRFTPNASVVTLSISTTEMASENYGWMAPAKAALESSLCFLAKSFSQFSQVRFNAVCPSLLKTSASAGIPNYIDSYLYAEKCTLRKKAVQTTEVSQTALFLLSPASSGINGQRIIIDAGMRLNYFDKNLVSP